MSFGENLQTLRKSKNISQEQLAERLDVSRQAVSKWESGGGFPETDKIITLCEFFGCSMDELMMGKVSVDKPSERKIYDDLMNRFSKGISLGVGLILFGLSTVILMSAVTLPHFEELGAVMLLLFVAAAVALFIMNGLEFENFRKQHPTMPEIYSEEEVNSFNSNVFPKAIALGVMLIFIAIIQIIVFEELFSVSTVGIFDLDCIPPALFFVFLAIAVMIFVYYGIQHEKYDIKKYNNEAPTSDVAIVRKKRGDLAGAVCGIIMLTATGLFLIGGALFNLWHPGWVLFPVGGLICGIVSLAFDNVPDAKQTYTQDGEPVVFRRESFGRRFLRKSLLATALSGIIMLSVTIIYLILGFVFMLWHPGWIIFPIGALLCGIVSLIVAIFERR